MNDLIKTNHEMTLEEEKQLITTLRNSLYPGAKEDSVRMAIHYCVNAKLDIMLKPIHIVPMWVVDKQTNKGDMRDVIMPGINLYRIQASRSGCAGISEPEFGEDVTECLGGVDITYPKWCRVTVKRIIQGQVVDFSAKEFWKENYATSGKDKDTGKVKLSPNAMWSKRPYAQLAKCAEAQALRKAFPEIASALTAEEMEGKAFDVEEGQTLIQSPKKKGMDALKAKLDISDAEVINQETGEIESPQSDTFNEVKLRINSAKNVDELIEAIDLARELKDDEKTKARELYKIKQKELGN